MRLEPFHYYRVLTSGNEFMVKATRFSVGFKSIYFYGRKDFVLHWFKKKEVCAITFEPPTEQDIERKEKKVGLMQTNKTTCSITDFEKLEEVEAGSIVAKLYQLIDDIDTAGDMFKPEIDGYFDYIQRKIRKSHELIVSDGYKLYYTKGKEHE